MIYAVEVHLDVIKVKQERETLHGHSKYHYFETHDAARRFIRERAAKEYQDAADQYRKARERMYRVRKKFAVEEQSAAGQRSTEEKP